MGQVKKALMEMEAECNAHVHPVFAQILSAFQPKQVQPSVDPYKPTTVYGLYVNGMLSCIYLHKDTADYECWLSRIGEEISRAETPAQYEVRDLPMFTHQPD